jgi:hypothetical protein
MPAPGKTFDVYNAQGIQFINSQLTTDGSTNTFTLYNAQITVTNSAPNPNLVTLDGLATPPTNNVLALFGTSAAITDISLVGPDPLLTLGSSTLTVSNTLNLGGTSTLNFGVGSNAAQIVVTGNLTLGGTLNVSDGGGFSNTTYTLFAYSGALTYNGLTLGSTPNTNFTYTISTNTVGQVNLVVAGATLPQNPFVTWALQYFGCTNSGTNCTQALPNADPYGKGISNTNQFLLGFNPTNAAAYLRVISIQKQSVAGNTNVVVTYLGASGDNTYAPGIASRTNVLDYLTGGANGSYTNGPWQDTGQTNILSGGNGSGTVTNMTDTAIPAPTNRFYRVSVLLP